mmetsp:Transcript_30587/g.65055  ORF Transcript_30587/g.65055 Transcript_30587/m.65055 type:complete len:95 (+) Transcript_30587:110-394(+)
MAIVQRPALCVCLLFGCILAHLAPAAFPWVPAVSASWGWNSGGSGGGSSGNSGSSGTVGTTENNTDASDVDGVTPAWPMLLGVLILAIGKVALH